MRDDRQAEAGSSQVGRSSRLRQLADLDLREAGFVERAPDAVLARSLPPRPVVPAVVGVVAVHHRREPALPGERREAAEELLLAVVAAVGRVGRVLGPIHLGGLEELVAQREVAGDAQRQLAMPRRIAGAVGGDRDRPVSEFRRRDSGQERAVDTAAERDDHGSAVAQDLPEVLFLEFQRAGPARHRVPGCSLIHSSQSSSSSSSASSSVLLVVEVVFVLVFFGRDVEFHRGDARDLEAAAALRAANEVALVHVELVDFDIGFALGARGHATPSWRWLPAFRPARPPDTPACEGPAESGSGL